MWRPTNKDSRGGEPGPIPGGPLFPAGDHVIELRIPTWRTVARRTRWACWCPSCAIYARPGRLRRPAAAAGLAARRRGHGVLHRQCAGASQPWPSGSALPCSSAAVRTRSVSARCSARCARVPSTAPSAPTRVVTPRSAAASSAALDANGWRRRGHRRLPRHQPQGAVGEDAQVPDRRQRSGARPKRTTAHGRGTGDAGPGAGTL